MKINKFCRTLFACLALAGFVQAVPAGARPAAADAGKTAENEVATTIRRFMAGFGAIKCNDVTAVSKFARNDMLYVTDNDIFAVSLKDYEDGLRQRACSWVSHTGTVDVVKVDMLAKDVAVAAWQYHDAVKLKTGKIVRTKGTTLMTLVRIGAGWKISSTMSNDVRLP